MDWSSGMDYGVDNGMYTYSWWHHCVLDSFIPSFQTSVYLPFHSQILCLVCAHPSRYFSVSVSAKIPTFWSRHRSAETLVLEA